MLNNSINLTAIVTSLPGKEQEMKALLLELVSHSTLEEACIQYDLHQVAEEPNVFIFHEIWRDAKGLEEHGNQPHILIFREASAPLLQEPLKIYITNRIK
jgi:quinol monooxygenase YgiN